MRVTLLCSNRKHPIMPYLHEWAGRGQESNSIEIIDSIRNASGGDILFLISCSEKIVQQDRDKYRKTLVLHASNLPEGRGWSPHVWDIIEGAEHLTLSLLEAEDAIDTGKIWKKLKIDTPKHMLWNEVNHALFRAEVELVEYAVQNLEKVNPQDQDLSISPTYRRKRTPEDSRLDPERSIAEQFNLIRICDPNRFPAYFDYFGQRYKLILEKVDE